MITVSHPRCNRGSGARCRRRASAGVSGLIAGMAFAARATSWPYSRAGRWLPIGDPIRAGSVATLDPHVLLLNRSAP